MASLYGTHDTLIPLHIRRNHMKCAFYDDFLTLVHIILMSFDLCEQVADIGTAQCTCSEGFAL